MLTVATPALYTTLRGKFVVWAELLDKLGLRGDERILDLGCGRGAVLLLAAQHLTTGRAVGVDLFGYVLFLAGMGIVTWAEAVNKFFEVTVRIQTERGQRVIDTGPYAVVRHPGYVASILFCVGTALCLGSVWALIPAGLASALLVLRTRWEDQTLQAELPGYQEYTQRVRYRLIPGVW
jgi:protein-S-isoprenylcysteine O-methyltransferase Ste14